MCVCVCVCVCTYMYAPDGLKFLVQLVHKRKSGRNLKSAQ